MGKLVSKFLLDNVSEVNDEIIVSGTIQRKMIAAGCYYAGKPDVDNLCLSILKLMPFAANSGTSKSASPYVIFTSGQGRRIIETI